MKRYCSQYTFCSPDKILRQTVIEQNDFKIITDIFNLNNQITESSNTLFLDGVISSRIASIKENTTGEQLFHISKNYQYIDLEYETGLKEIIPNGKPILLDFGTFYLPTVNQLLQRSLVLLSQINAFDIIAGSVYYPLKAMNKELNLQVGEKSDLLLWKGINLLNKKVTKNLRVVSITE